MITVWGRRNSVNVQKVLWLIGPEGDFTPAEMSAAKSAAPQPVTPFPSPGARRKVDFALIAGRQTALRANFFGGRQ